MKRTAAKTLDRKKIRKINEERGHINVYSTFNNTIVNISRVNGEVLWQASSGSSGFRGAKKATPYAAQKVAESAIGKASEFGIFTFLVRVRGIGAGRDAVIRKLFNTRDLQIEELVDTTGFPHNGCRPPKKPRK